MRWFYSQGFDYGRGLPDLPTEVHGFVLNKPTQIRDGLIASSVATAAEMCKPEPIGVTDLKRVHYMCFGVQI